MGEGEGMSQALRPPAPLPGRWATKGLRTGVAAAHAGDLPLWKAKPGLHKHQENPWHVCA